MLLKYPSAQLQSISELKRLASHQSLEKLQKPFYLQKQSSTELSRGKSQSKQFIPFCQQRDLGRLLQKKNLLNQKSSDHTSVQKLLDMVTFKNFKKLYRMEKKNEETKYALQIRLSGQKNLINQDEWILNDIRKNHSNNHQNSTKSVSQKSRLTSSLSRLNLQQKPRQCCKNTHLSSHSGPKKAKSFSKIDLQLYKKLSTNRPPSSKDPELNTLYEHYVQSCQLNQNQRRRLLTQRKK